jgi:hypothetical protein
MEFHALDLITWFVICILIHIILPRDFTEEIGGLVYVGIVFVFSIVWLILFVFCGFNVIDIINSKAVFFNLKW